MPEVGKRPSQFNPISRYRDNTDDLESEAARVAARIRRKTITEFTGQTDPATPKVVPPMPAPSSEGG